MRTVLVLYVLTGREGDKAGGSTSGSGGRTAVLCSQSKIQKMPDVVSSFAWRALKCEFAGSVLKLGSDRLG